MCSLQKTVSVGWVLLAGTVFCHAYRQLVPLNAVEQLVVWCLTMHKFQGLPPMPLYEVVPTSSTQSQLHSNCGAQAYAAASHNLHVYRVPACKAAHGGIGILSALPAPSFASTAKPFMPCIVKLQRNDPRCDIAAVTNLWPRHSPKSCTNSHEFQLSFGLSARAKNMATGASQILVNRPMGLFTKTHTMSECWNRNGIGQKAAAGEAPS